MRLPLTLMLAVTIGACDDVAPDGLADAVARSTGSDETRDHDLPAGAPRYPQLAGPTARSYVFATFNNTASGNTTLLIYTSKDALNFSLLTDTRYGGKSGNLRDPSIMRHSDKRYYVAYTTPPDRGCCGPESSFSIAVSEDLRRWTTLTTVPSGISGVYNTWAPEFFKDSDGKIHLLVNISTSTPKSFKTYVYTALNAELTQWSKPTPIGIGPNYIDTFVVKVEQTYHAFTKNETTLFIEHATAPNLAGPWTFVGKNDWAGWGGHREGPALVQLPGGTWRLYLDGYGKERALYSDSRDGFATWTPLKKLPAIGEVVSHGTVIAVD